MTESLEDWLSMLKFMRIAIQVGRGKGKKKGDDVAEM